MRLSDMLKDFEGFDWDKGNSEKNWIKHHVKYTEAQEVFFNKPLLLMPDPQHSQTEQRYGCFGRTNQDRKLFVVFTVRGQRIRVISARDQSREEKENYVKKIETYS